jgi:hypothetical protein
MGPLAAVGGAAPALFLNFLPTPMTSDGWAGALVGLIGCLHLCRRLTHSVGRGGSSTGAIGASGRPGPTGRRSRIEGPGDVATHWALSAASSGLEAEDVPKRALNAAAEALASMAAHVHPNQAFDTSEGHVPATLLAELDEHLARLKEIAGDRSPKHDQAGDIPEH